MFTAYLRGAAERDDLAAALAQSGHPLEASLLQDERRAWVSATLPVDAQPGDLWLDTVELMPMRLISGDDAPLGWLALRPVERWQFGAFMNVARWSGSTQRIGD